MYPNIKSLMIYSLPLYGFQLPFIALVTPQPNPRPCVRLWRGGFWNDGHGPPAAGLYRPTGRRRAVCPAMKVNGGKCEPTRKGTGFSTSKSTRKISQNDRNIIICWKTVYDRNIYFVQHQNILGRPILASFADLSRTMCKVSIDVPEDSLSIIYRKPLRSGETGGAGDFSGGG